jgi:hypothetical protein
VQHKAVAAQRLYLRSAPTGRAAARVAYVGRRRSVDDYIVSVGPNDTGGGPAAAVEHAADVMIEPETIDLLGPAINSGNCSCTSRAMASHTPNGSLAASPHLWIPQTIVEDGQFLKLFDASFHEPVRQSESTLLRSAGHDARWIKIRRPTVVVGGELTMDALEIRHDPVTNVSEASLQMKSNCGCLLIDDFGRQRIEPTELLNRWIVPLENRHDFLTLATGKKIQVPFEQLIIFSTNLEPKDLADDAFLRRIPYKIEIGDPSIEELWLSNHAASRWAVRFSPRQSTISCRRITGRTTDRCGDASHATFYNRWRTTARSTGSRCSSTRSCWIA